MKFTGVAIASILSTLTLFSLSCYNHGSATSTTAVSTENPSSKTGDSVSGVGASACSLLTPTEVEVATGAKMGDPHQSDLSAQGAPPNSQACSWYATAQNAQLELTIGPPPPGVSAESAAKYKPGMDALRAAHWTEEDKSFGTTSCFMMTPPASQKEGVMMCSCSGEVKGLILSVTIMSPAKKLSIEETKMLLDKAIARFH
ncbi:MAG TPA: hypothetical protein VGV87_19445 [Blastocatellia bacterium]|nr:hypothetical protein [Blastocatellia bacterium]